MIDTHLLVRELYSFFSGRDVDACLARMTEDVEWPKASEGGRVTGKDQVRAYWERQWKDFDPHVEPVGIADRENGVEVTVHQVVKALDGTTLFDGIVGHSFTLRNGLVSRMDLADVGDSGDATTAFGRP